MIYLRLLHVAQLFHTITVDSVWVNPNKSQLHLQHSWKACGECKPRVAPLQSILTNFYCCLPKQVLEQRFDMSIQCLPSTSIYPLLPKLVANCHNLSHFVPPCHTLMQLVTFCSILSLSTRGDFSSCDNDQQLWEMADKLA